MARVLMIGATSAIATEVAKLCAARGDDLYLLARSRERLAAVVDQLGDRVVGTESGDFYDLEENAGRVARGIACLGGLDLAIIAHGALGDQLRSESEPDHAWQIFDVNQRSVISFLIPLANEIEAQGHGGIAVMSSVAAERGRPRNYTYGAAKSAVNVYLQGLRSRLRPTGGRIHILKLGPAHTPMTLHHEKNALFADPEQLAVGILRAVAGRRSEVYLPWFWRPIMTVVRCLPESVFQRIAFLSGR